MSGTEHIHDDHCICGHDHHAEGGVGHDRAMGKIIFVLLGGGLTLNAFALGRFFPGQTFAAEMSALAGAVVLALPIVLTAIRDLVNGKVYMNELVALAILAALANGDFKIAGIIAFFLLTTIIIETRTASGAQRSIEELVRLTPDTVRVPDGNGGEREVEAACLSVGDRILVRPGENFPVDARISSGESTVNQSSITGESVPVEKGVGDDVYAGTQNLTGAVEAVVTKVGADTTLGKVKDMILQAENARTPVVRIIDRYASYYTPTVLMMAWIRWWVTEDMNAVIAFLVISCPCAIVLATPTAVVAAVAAASRLGIFIKDVGHLELASRIRSFVFDKTGTLTDGQLSVVEIHPEAGYSKVSLLQVAASAEAFSNHPTARAIVKLADEAGIIRLEVKDFKEVHGKGVTAIVAGAECLIGRASHVSDGGTTVSQEGQSNMSVVHVVHGGKALGWIGLRDKIRKESADMLLELRKVGVKHIAMVTGDRGDVAAAVAGQLQIDEFESECLPEGKVEFVRKEKQNGAVAVVGDGVNDAPALAEGDLGIAMGAIGSDVAINSASIALMTNDLGRIPLLMKLSRKSQTIIYENLVFGMIFVFGGMMTSAIGYLTPVWAAVLHAASTLVIIFNSARLVRMGEECTAAENEK
ncbi:MAG: cadmium-translocating P-type ATPase [Victivallaceae bacterium]|nr:cadmium-translocating P-type ATPase [Victivallaceae bacterium]